MLSGGRVHLKDYDSGPVASRPFRCQNATFVCFLTNSRNWLIVRAQSRQAVCKQKSRSKHRARFFGAKPVYAT